MVKFGYLRNPDICRWSVGWYAGRYGRFAWITRPAFYLIGIHLLSAAVGPDFIQVAP